MTFFSYSNIFVYFFYQPLAALSVKRFKALAEIIGHTILRKQVKNMLARHSFRRSIFFNAESDEKGYVFVFLAHYNSPFCALVTDVCLRKIIILL